MADQTYQTANGPKTLTQMVTELNNNGYGGPYDPQSLLNAYQQVTKGPVTETPAPAVDPTQDPYYQDYKQFMSDSAGFSLKQLQQAKDQADAQLAFQKQQLEEQGLPQLAINQQLADLQEQQFQEAVKESNRNYGLQVAQTAANLSGPADWVKAYNFERGVSGVQGVPQFMNDLLTGRNGAAYVGPAVGAQMSDPQSLANLATQMGGAGVPGTASGTPTAGATGTPTSGATSPQQTDAMAQSLAAAKSIFSQGGGAFGPQTMESLGPTGTQMLTGIGGAVGADVPGFMDQYAKSRIGQNAAYGS